jgi:hypothetical protein
LSRKKIPQRLGAGATSNPTADTDNATREARGWWLLPSELAAPIYCLLVIAGLSTAGILVLGNPSPKAVDLALRCKGVTLPRPMDVDITGAATVQMRGIGLKFDHIASVRSLQTVPGVDFGSSKSLSLLPPSVSTVPVVPVVRMSIDEAAPRVAFSLTSGVYISTEGCSVDQTACATFRAAGGSGVGFSLQATQIELDANRVVLRRDDDPQPSR